MTQENGATSDAQSNINPGDVQSNISGPVKQGSRLSAPPFQPTTSVLNTHGEAVAWDLLEQSCREIGVPATAQKYDVKPKAILARKLSHKWKGIPDARSLAKVKQGSSAEITSDLSSQIAPFRERAFRKINDSLGKFKPKAPKSFRELDSCVKIGERMLCIGEDTGAKQSVIVHINEAIDAFNPDSLPHEIVEAETVEQGSSESPPAQLTQANVSNETVEQGSN